MDNISQPENIQPEQGLTEPPAPVIITPPKKRSKMPFLIGGGLLAGICLCAALCVAVLGASLVRVVGQRDDVAKVIDAFMQAMSNRDTDKAYSLFSSRARKQMPLSRIEDLLKGSNYAVFDGYTETEVGYLNIGPAFSTNPDRPQGTVAKVSGTVAYNDGTTGKFEAVLEQENGGWKLYTINVVVPPNKISDYSKKNP